jgi:hypothetical protein
VIDSSEPEARTDGCVRRSDGGAKRGRYLPSAQVLTELASLGPDLGKLADDLRVHLSDPADGRPGVPPLTA